MMAARGPCECVYVCVLCLYVVFVLCVCMGGCCTQCECAHVYVV